MGAFTRFLSGRKPIPLKEVDFSPVSVKILPWGWVGGWAGGRSGSGDLLYMCLVWHAGNAQRAKSAGRTADMCEGGCVAVERRFVTMTMSSYPGLTGEEGEGGGGVRIQRQSALSWHLPESVTTLKQLRQVCVGIIASLHRVGMEGMDGWGGRGDHAQNSQTAREALGYGELRGVKKETKGRKQQGGCLCIITAHTKCGDVGSVTKRNTFKKNSKGIFMFFMQRGGLFTHTLRASEDNGVGWGGGGGSVGRTGRRRRANLTAACAHRHHPTER